MRIPHRPRVAPTGRAFRVCCFAVQIAEITARFVRKLSSMATLPRAAAAKNGNDPLGSLTGLRRGPGYADADAEESSYDSDGSEEDAYGSGVRV